MVSSGSGPFHRWWSKLPLSSLFQSIFHLCFPLRSKASYCFPHHWVLRTGPRKALYWACSLFLLIPLFESIHHFSSYPSAFSCAGQPSEALFELPSDIACCERSRNGFTGGCSLSNWYFPYDSDCGLPEIRPILLLLLNQLGLTWLWPLSDRWSMKTLDP